MPALAPPENVSQRRLEAVAHALLLATALASLFSIAAMQALLALSLLAWLASFRGRAGRPLRLPLLPFFAGLLGVALLSAALSGVGSSVEHALRKGILPLSFFAAVDLCASERRLERAGRTVVLGAALAALFGLAQAWQRGTELRVSGAMGLYMTYAGVLMIAGLVTLARAIGAPSARERRLCWAALPLVLAALALTQTRGAWLGFGAGALLLVLAWRPKALLLLPLLLAIGYVAAPSAVKQRAHSLFDRQDATANDRLFLWRAGLSMVEAHPLLGVGPRNTRAAFAEHRHPDDPRPADQGPGHLHSSPVQIAAETGLVGLALWLALWARTLARVLGLRRRLLPGQRAARVAVDSSLAALAGFLVMGLFEHNWADSEVATLALFTLGLAFAAEAAAGAGLRESEPVASA